MEKSKYEKIFSKRLYLVLCKAEELCKLCQYESISPAVLFAAMVLLEKQFVQSKIGEIGLNFNEVCMKIETQLANMHRIQKDDYVLSPSSIRVFSSAQSNSVVVTLVDLLREIIRDTENCSLFGNVRIDEGFSLFTPDIFLMYNSDTGQFETCVRSYYDEINNLNNNGPTNITPMFTGC